MRRAWGFMFVMLGAWPSMGCGDSCDNPVSFTATYDIKENDIAAWIVESESFVSEINCLELCLLIVPYPGNCGHTEMLECEMDLSGYDPSTVEGKDIVGHATCVGITHYCNYDH